MTAKTLAVLGASGHGKVVAELAELNGYSVVFFDDAFAQKKRVEHWCVLGDTNDLLQRITEYAGVVVGIGNNAIREQKTKLLLDRKANLVTLVHPSAVVSKYSTLGAGTVVMAQAVINPFTTVEQGVIINTKAVVEHDCWLGAFCHVSPNASLAGECKLLERAWFGINSCAKQQLTIGADAVVGAGSVVVKNIAANAVAFGNPAEVKKDSN